MAIWKIKGVFSRILASAGFTAKITRNRGFYAQLITVVRKEDEQ